MDMHICLLNGKIARRHAIQQLQTAHLRCKAGDHVAEQNAGLTMLLCTS